ncbi:hypothetical protein B7463_g9365, partial [Scytalidium lignicola]
MKLTTQVGRKLSTFFVLLKKKFATMPHSGTLSDRAVYRMPDTNVVILGCSLFSSISAESEMAVGLGLNDFFDINNWDVNSHNEAHKMDIAWLNTQVAELEQLNVRIMIFTHWSPSRDARAIDPRHATSSITSAFSTDLSEEKCFKSEKVKIWAFGHTHYNSDFTVERKGTAESLRLLANQRGYYFAQADGYDGEKTVNILAPVLDSTNTSHP